MSARAARRFAERHVWRLPSLARLETIIAADPHECDADGEEVWRRAALTIEFAMPISCRRVMPRAERR
jgi:hypothetical protein